MCGGYGGVSLSRHRYRSLHAMRACEKVCQAIHPVVHAAASPEHVHAAWSSDLNVRAAGSSGGLFAMLAAEVLARSGGVFGASFNESASPEAQGCPHVLPRPPRSAAPSTSNLQSAARTRMPASFSRTLTGCCSWERPARYRVCASILASGTIALLPSTWFATAFHLQRCFASMYRSREEATALPSSIIASETSRAGWNQFEVSARFANGAEYRRVFHEDVFMAGFLENLYLRPRHECAHACLPRVGDLTLGDFWASVRSIEPSTMIEAPRFSS